MDYEVCHLYGGEITQWQGQIYECEDCGNMLDLSVFEDDEEELEEVDE